MGSCEDCRKKRDTKLCQGDLILCKECNEKRFPSNSKHVSKPVIRQAPKPSKTLKEVAKLITERHMSIVHNMTLDELKTFNELITMQTVQKDITTLMPDGYDKTEIANESFNVASKLRKEAEARAKQLTRPVSPGSVVRAIFASPLRPATPSAKPTTAPQGGPTSTAKVSTIKCVETCKLEHIDQGKTFQCSFCDKAFHQDCFGLKRKPTAFFCTACKLMPSLIQSQADTIDAMQDTLRAYQVQFHELNTNSIKQTQEIKELKTTLRNRTTPTARTTESQTAAVQLDLPADSAEEPTGPINQGTAVESREHVGKLLIGDSMIRDIDARGLANTEVKSLSGAKVQHVRDCLDRLDVQKYQSVIIHVATNECTSDTRLSNALDEYDEMIRDVQSRAPNTNIVVSTACPRTDDGGKHQARVDRMNIKIKDIASKRGCLLVDNDKNFTHGDKSADTSVINKRGLHLNKEGTKRLLKNIDTVSKVIKTRRQREQPHVHHIDSRPDAGHHHHQHPNPRPNRTTGRRTRGKDAGHHRPDHDPRGPRGCYFCGTANHSMKNCKYGQPIQCFGCGAYGHKVHQNICHLF